ncbi:MAG TPA: mannitol-1-phosphate 5-dehydrogenase [Sporolactobacillaceae bacterium]|nr:mannitol-1-phosphate 5-dehydrogenase [Sporolactobacillaceae bacterium]
MKAVHFGAGNIGRGFIGSLLDQSGFTTIFVDVNAAIIDAINEKKEYVVELASPNHEQFVVKHIEGINSQTNPDKVIQAITEADLVTTAVGPNILPIIARLIVEGLRARASQNDTPLNLIACENMIGGSDLLKKSIYNGLSEDEVQKFDDLFGFPNAAVDRIVPNQSHEDLLKVSVEPFYEWVVEETAIKGERPPVKGITYVPELGPYIERKLFTVNTGHALTAYLGYLFGVPTIAEAMANTRIHSIVEGALRETGRLLIEKHGFNSAEHWAYVDKILRRFINPNLEDEPTRVGRSPLRKLGPEDRLVSPSRQYLDRFDEVPKNLVMGIAAALHFDFKGDEEATKLQDLIQTKGVEDALLEVTGLTKGSRLVEPILSAYDAFKKER